MNESERLAAVRKAPTTDAAFAMAFGGAQPFPQESHSREQQQHPETAAPQPSVAEISAGTARAMAKAGDPQALAAHLEAMALETMRAERRAIRAEEELAALKGTTKARLDTFKRTGNA